jgi:hypothetical protein
MTKNQKRKTPAKRTFGQQLILIFSVLMGAVFMPTTFLLMIGMLPTPFAVLVDRTRGKNKVIAVGALNLAGCAPFLLELWTTEHTFEKSFDIITDPMAIIIMWSAAAVGYLVNWAMTGIVAASLYQRGLARQKLIKKKQDELIERWGKEVTGEMKLNEFGFPAEDLNNKPPKK